MPKAWPSHRTLTQRYEGALNSSHRSLSKPDLTSLAQSLPVLSLLLRIFPAQSKKVWNKKRVTPHHLAPPSLPPILHWWSRFPGGECLAKATEDGGKDMEEIKRLIIAFLIIIGIIFLWQVIFSPPPVKETIPETTKQDLPSPLPPTPLPPIQATPKGEFFTLENEKLFVRLSNQGATVRSVYLKEHECEILSDSPNLTLIAFGEGKTFNLDTLLWEAVAETNKITFWVKEGELVFSRSYWLEAGYRLISETKVKDGKESIPLAFISTIPFGLAFTERDTQDEYNHFRILSSRNNEIQGKSVKRLRLPVKEGKDLSWLGFTTKYFLMVVKTSSDSLLLSPNGTGKVRTDLFFSRPPEISLAFYPLKYNLLVKEGEGLEKAVPLGWPKFLSIAILHLLLFLHSLFKNYGLVIIVFSILMKGALFPLTRVQTQQMKRLSLLQPKLEELKRRYKDDPKRLNQEMMRLYSVHKMNPLAGCLPLLAQLPIFWALYSVLRSTVELRRAQFIFWIKDLSLKDPFYILPILMGISFLFQNLLTAQDKKNLFMTLFFPIFLTVIFLNFPSGLQLYWLTFNLLSLGESFIFHRGGKIWKK